ncbi:hypothetical protein J2S13_001392 [Oikeobacillus pervagus]|uniref:Uncharacterized protein n=1 Tax=Oikeobacillus pervagus TaxID=1325931 RepID=A0AAJ1WJ37_9BACI|nr:hypothetical protein [Oikeobacillus pervagus]MDQ0214993.1 hypothetical protein [Oikeobacillus pervagus]
MRQKYILILLLAGLLLYYAVPRLNIYASGIEGLFSVVWLVFAIIVIAGNLSASLYSPTRVEKLSTSLSTPKKIKKDSMRSYG